MSQSIYKYSITHDLDSAAVGVYPQIQEFSRTHPAPGKLFYSKTDGGRFPQDTSYPVYRMENKAKLTDLVSIAPLDSSQLMISHDCVRLFENATLPEYQLFPLQFVYKGRLIQTYFAFSIVRDPVSLNYISWKHSRFYKTSNYHRIRISEFEFDSLEEMWAARKQIEHEEGFGWLADIKINFHSSFDLIHFDTYPLNFGFLCTEAFRKKIENAGLTGFRFDVLPEDLFVSE